jgi:threonyl-tRNA synthetase
MRGLIWKANQLSFRDVEKSTRPKIVSKYIDFNPKRKVFSNVINIWLCAEKNDQDSYVTELVGRIKELNKSFYHLNQIIIFPFGHLSNNLASPEKAKSLLTKLKLLLEKDRFNVDMASFGTHKDIAFESLGQPAQVSYFEFPKKKV